MSDDPLDELRRRFTGVIAIDKTVPMTSGRVVTRVKRLIPRGVKVGHAGTLDPFATGVLLVLVGRATRWCEHLMAQSKEYVATIKLGATTPTLDPDSPEVIHPDARDPGIERARQVLAGWVGTRDQMPPAYSALKIGGRKAYALARLGRPVQLQPRPVRIEEIELLDYAWPMLTIRLVCGRGTYVRSLARDVGVELGMSGYVAALRRTRVGEFRDDQSIGIEQLAHEGVESRLRDSNNQPVCGHLTSPQQA